MADLPTRTAYARVESELVAEVFLGIYKKRWNLHGNLRVLPQCQPPAGRALLKDYIIWDYEHKLSPDKAFEMGLISCGRWHWGGGLPLDSH